MGLDEVAELRSLLRRVDPVARQLAYGLLDGWEGSDLDDLGARAVLEAAAGSYPEVPGDHRDPGESLARVLWERPRIVTAEEVLRAFLIAGDRARRAFLHLLALRRDSDGLEALESLFSVDGPRELLPAALMPVLDPLLGMQQRDRVVAFLCAVLSHGGWVWHAADLLVRTQQGDGARPGEQIRILAATSVLVEELVDACDRACTRDPTGERARTGRERLAAVARLLDQLTKVSCAPSLHRMLASADPRVSAMGAVRLVRSGGAVAPERLELIARDAVARADLYEALSTSGLLEALPEVVDHVAVHEAMLARWLCEVTELGRAPDEMELIGTRRGPATLSGGGEAVLFLFRFRLRSPHWSASRGWMVGVAGPWTGSCYQAEDECSLDEHVESIRSSLDMWPRGEDGAA